MSSRPAAAADAFRLLERLASGGMADIFLARQNGSLDKECVIKRLRAEYRDQDDYVDMFLDEAHMAASFRHHNLPQLFEIGWSEDGLPFYAMEYLEGCDCRALLRSVRRRGAALPIDCVLSIAIGAAAGLHHAHFAASSDGIPLRIVHRDVSASNIFVTVDGSVKVVDFGVARANRRRTMTIGGKLKGKTVYMSPEQVLGDPIDHRSDIFSLGIVLYELVTGERPFDHHDAGDLEVLNRISRASHPPPSRIRGDIPPGLEAIIERALEREPARRFATADAMAEALEELARSLGLSLSSRRLGRVVRELTGRPERSAVAQPDLSLVEARPPATERLAASTEIQRDSATTIPVADTPAARRTRWGVIAALGLAVVGGAIVGVAWNVQRVSSRDPAPESRSLAPAPAGEAAVAPRPVAAGGAEAPMTAGEAAADTSAPVTVATPAPSPRATARRPTRARQRRSRESRASPPRPAWEPDSPLPPVPTAR